MGRKRNLVGKQRARIAHQNSSQSQGADVGCQGPSHDAQSPEDAAFDTWFCNSFEIWEHPDMSQRATFGEWTRSYENYCRSYGVATLAPAVIVKGMRAFAQSYQCELEEPGGDFVGGRLK